MCFFRDENGQATTEYALLLLVSASVTLTVIWLMSLFGNILDMVFNDGVSFPPIKTEEVVRACSSDREPLSGPSVGISVSIGAPIDCEKGMSQVIRVGGTYEGDLTGKDLWVLVYPTNNQYYPQTLDACRQAPSEASNGIWNTIVHLGGPPQQYDLVAVITEADSEASQQFKDWLKDGCTTYHYPGYSVNALPDGITEVATITVSRKADDAPKHPPIDDCPIDDIRFRTPIGGLPVNETVMFEYPDHCEMALSRSITAGGRYTGSMDDKELWILVYPKNSQYFPQAVNACDQAPSDMKDDGIWLTNIYFGGPPQVYDVVAVITEVNGKASQEFKNWLKTGCDTGHFPGYLKQDLPDGITEVAAITVSTQ